MKTFREKTAIVTGGASGIGRALCLALGRQGAVVTVSDINLEGAERVAAEVRKQNGRAQARRTDVTQRSEVRDQIGWLIAEGVGLLGARFQHQ